jgi:twitching motility two-component system response regulator PilH
MKWSDIMARVLVVDDAQEAIEFIQRALRSAGHEVSAALDATGLEQRIANEQPDVLLLDVVLPERNGFQILRALRRSEDTRELPIILVSSKKEPTDVEWGMLQGATAYLTKPFSADHLLDLVARHS